MNDDERPESVRLEFAITLALLLGAMAFVVTVLFF